MKFKIENEVFEKFPDLVVAIPVIMGFDNTKSQDEALAELRGAQEGLKKTMAQDKFWKDPRITSYLDCFRGFGADPLKIVPTHVALSKRVFEGKDIPNINPMVNLYNAKSLEYLTPFGGEDLDQVYGDFVLRFAKAGEQWIPIGGAGSKPTFGGDLIWVDDFDVSTKSLNWRQCERTKMTPETKNGYFIMDGFSGVNRDNIQKAAEDFVNTAEKLFGGRGVIYWLGRGQPEVEVPFKTKKMMPAGKKAMAIEKEKTEKVKTRTKEEKKSNLVQVGLAVELQGMIYEAVYKAAGACIPQEEIQIEHPANESFGDYSTNVAMTMAPGLKKNPRELAEEISKAISQQLLRGGLIESVSVAGPGFINIRIKTEYLGKQLEQVLKKKDSFGSGTLMAGKKILIEHTSPNPQTTIMLGHLRNNFLGMTMGRLWEAEGAVVNRDCIVNDRGVHLCRSMIGYLVFADKDNGLPLDKLKNFRGITDEEILKSISGKDWKEMIADWKMNMGDWLVPLDLGLKPDHANLIWYVLGSQAYTLSEEIQRQVGEMLVIWEKKDKLVWELWKMILDWSADGYDQTYRRIGSKHEWVWHESDHFERGKEIVTEGLEKGVFVKSEGAIVTDLAAFGLPDTVVVKGDGTALYITQDLALTKLKREKFPSDLYVWDIGEEQSLYLKQMFSICEQLGIGKLADYLHLGFALVNFKGGKKMSTRKGNVVMADEILDGLRDRALILMKSSKQELRGELPLDELTKLAEKVAVGAIKYSLLVYGRNTTMYFDPDQSLSLEGNSGPYLQYTFARTQSVLRKSDLPKSNESLIFQFSDYQFNQEEMALLRWVYRFPETVAEAAQTFSPNLICNFLFELAQRYNLFYQKHRILGEGVPENSSNFRLLLTKATGQVMKNGLGLLGIETPEKM